MSEFFTYTFHTTLNVKIFNLKFISEILLWYLFTNSGPYAVETYMDAFDQTVNVWIKDGQLWVLENG